MISSGLFCVCRNNIDLEISQTLEEMKRQNEVRRLQERQEQVWLDHVTDDRKVLGENPTGFAWKLWQFSYPTLPVSFARDTKSSWSLLSGVYARGSKISHTWGN